MKAEPICCPLFDPEVWDNKISVWDHKPFIKANVPSFFYMPIGFGRVMSKLIASGHVTDDNLCLTDIKSKWSMDVYLAVKASVPDANNVNLSGQFISKVYEGPFKDTGAWIADFKAYIKDKNYPVDKMYMWYTTCPKCAKKYGKNYVVLLSKI